MCSLFLFLVIVHIIATVDTYSYEESFGNYLEKFKKPYSRNDTEYKRRFATFKSNLVQIKKLNAMRTHASSAHYGVTEFSDLTPSEFKEKYLSSYNYNSSHVKEAYPILQSFGLPGYPPTLDWRKHGIITPVKNQKTCGGCWAFSTIETMESMNAKMTRNLLQYSVQELIDCSDGAKGLAGCSGGDIQAALIWLKMTHYPMVLEKQYPDTDRNEFCKFAPQKARGLTVANFTCYTYLNEYDMVRSLADHGPLTVSVDATNWMNYQGGVIQHHCGQHRNNHAVQIVGYNTTAEVPYFIVRNSWGTKFGHQGYLYVKIGGNTCGIAREVATLNVR